jgi:hypothetical protein
MNSQTAPTRFPNPADRRTKPRLDCTYPVVLRQRQGGGNVVESQATITNISASGMYLRTQHYIPRGQTLFIMARLSNQPSEIASAPNLAATVEVVRVEPKPDGSYGVAVRMQRHRFV